MKRYWQILSPILIPLSWLYGCIIWIYNQLYKRELIKTSVFNKPVISVGNITSGGTGKTPLVIYLAQLLQRSGKKPGIVSRGYGRKNKGLKVVHDGKKLLYPVEITGDEPYLIAHTLKNVPVIVSEDRSYGVKQLLDYYFADVIIMDDGFQHRKVKRDLDILTISANDIKTDYRLLPWGNLREPLKNIERADVVIYTKIESHKTPAIDSEIQFFIKSNPINSSFLPILMKHNTLGFQKSLPPDKPIFAFCGIADPRSFLHSAEKLSLQVKGKRFFKDHQDYTETVIGNLSEQIKTNNISHVVTTEKDLVKLPDSFLSEFEIFIIRINIKFENEANIKSLIQPLLLK